jgi:hypothetical protein
MDTGLIMFTLGTGLGVLTLSVGMLAFEEKMGVAKKPVVNMLTTTPDSVSYLNVSVLFGRDISEAESLFTTVDGLVSGAIVNDISASGSLDLSSKECSGACEQIVKKLATFNKTGDVARELGEARPKGFAVKDAIRTSAFSKVTNLIHVVTPNYDKTTKTEEKQISELSSCYANALTTTDHKAMAIPVLGTWSGFPFEKSVILGIHHAFCCPFEVYIHVADKSRFTEVRNFFMERVNDFDKLKGMADKEKEAYFKSHTWSTHYSKEMLKCVMKCS